MDDTELEELIEIRKSLCVIAEAMDKFVTFMDEGLVHVTIEKE